MKILLLPGLGADRRLMLPVAERLGGEAHDLPRHLPGESFSAYARRAVCELSGGEPFYGVGFSFGGMMFLESARDPAIRTLAQGVTLVSSCRSRHAITAAFKRQVKIGALVPAPLARWGLVTVLPRQFVRENRLTETQAETVHRMAEQADLKALQWGAEQCSAWDFEGPEVAYPDFPVAAIHGERDTTIPLPPGDPAHILKNAHHLITLTHPEEVAQLIREQLPS